MDTLLLEEFRIDTLNVKNSFNLFRNYLVEKGFKSPMLGAMKPCKVLTRKVNNQEILCMVLEGELTIKSLDVENRFGKHEIFFIEASHEYEVKAGHRGSEFLFAFKNV
jgi:hypothetical protein